MNRSKGRAWHSLDTVFESLANERRRYVLYHLRSTLDNVATFTELRDAVASRESETGLPSQETVDRVAISLKHSHLPKLDDAGLIDYDVRTETIRYREETATKEFIHLAHDREMI